MAKSKDELLKLFLSPDTPQVIKNLIEDHPALLGGCIQVKSSNEATSFVDATNSIIQAHGFARIQEWEYECDRDRNVECLRIWIGDKRRDRNMRVLTLTAEQKAQIQPHLSQQM